MVLILILYILFLVVMVIFWAKNNNTYRNHSIIGDAIHRYAIDMINKHQWDSIEVKYDDMEPYETTLFRVWDWGYEHILPPEKFEIIKPYII